MNLVYAVQVCEPELRELLDNITTEFEDELLTSIVDNLYKGKVIHLVYLLIKGNSFGYGGREELWTSGDFNPIWMMVDQSHAFLPFDDLYSDVPDPVGRYMEVEYPYISEFGYIMKGFDRVSELEQMIVEADRDLSQEVFHLLYKVFTYFERNYLSNLRDYGKGLLYVKNTVVSLDILSV